MRIRTMAANVTILIAAAALARPMSAAGAKPAKPADIPVHSYLLDADAAGTAYTLQSDSRGAYVNGADGVVSILMANVYNSLYNGDWEMIGSAVRTVAVTLGPDNAIPAGSPGYTVPPDPPFWGTGLVAAKVMLQCTETNQSMRTMTAGSIIFCPLGVRWDVTRTTFYRLNMSGLSGSPESAPAQITCSHAGTAGCDDWYVDPIPTVNPDGSVSPGSAVARLVYGDTKGQTNLGDFYMRYHFHITQP